MLAQGADGRVHKNAAAVHFHAKGGQSVADDGGGHRAVELVVVAHMHGNDHVQGFQTGLQALRIGAQGVHTGLQLFAFLLKNFEVGRRSHHGQALGQQKIAAVTGLDFNHVAKVAEIFHVGAKNKFHVRLLRWCSFS